MTPSTRPGPGTHSGTGTLGRLRWMLAAAAAIIVVVAIWQLAGDPDDDGGTPAPDGSGHWESTDDDLVGPVESSAVLIHAESGRSITFHAVYAATTGDRSEGLGISGVSLWRADGWTRQDTVTQGPDGTTRTQAVRDPDGVVTLCAMSVDGTWGCTEQLTDVDNDLFLSAATQLASLAVEATDVTIEGHEGTCYRAAEEDSAELCYRTDGVPLRLASPTGGTLEVVSIDDDVDDSVFTTPEDGSVESTAG